MARMLRLLRMSCRFKKKGDARGCNHLLNGCSGGLRKRIELFRLWLSNRFAYPSKILRIVWMLQRLSRFGDRAWKQINTQKSLDLFAEWIRSGLSSDTRTLIQERIQLSPKHSRGRYTEPPSLCSPISTSTPVIAGSAYALCRLPNGYHRQTRTSPEALSISTMDAGSRLTM